MEVVKINVDGEEMDFITSLEENDIDEIPIVDEPTIRLNKIIEEVNLINDGGSLNE